MKSRLLHMGIVQLEHLEQSQTQRESLGVSLDDVTAELQKRRQRASGSTGSNSTAPIPEAAQAS